MNIKSKFNFFAIFIICWITIIPFLVVYLSATSRVAGMLWPVLFVAFIIFFWLTVFRTRAYKVEIEDDSVIVKRYFGAGKSVVYDFTTLDGFITLIESAKGGVYESLFILKNGKRIGSISSFYHSNFEELKSILSDKLNDMGERESSFTGECTELFK